MKKLTKRFLNVALALGAAVLSTTITARADVQYTTEMSMMQGGKLTPFSTTTTWIKAGLQRTDSQQNLGMVRQSESTILRCAKREQLRFDPSLKIYAVEPVGANGTVGGSTPGARSGKPGVGKIIMTSKVKFIGREKIAGRVARHYQITQRMQSTGCAGNSDTTLKSEIWVADATLPVVSCGPSAGDWKQGYNAGGGCKISFEQRGDTKAFQAAYKGLLMKSITYDASGKPTMQMRITKLSFANLSPKSFEAPAGFKKQSRADYDKTRQDAMIAAMTKGG